MTNRGNKAVITMLDWQSDGFVWCAITSFANACPDLRDRTLLINGVSKAYAMTGWRLGYAAGPEDLTKVQNKMQSQSTTCPSSIKQAAAVAALNGPQDFVTNAVAECKSRGELVAKGFAATPGLEVRAPEGAFYLFPKCALYQQGGAGWHGHHR